MKKNKILKITVFPEVQGVRFPAKALIGETLTVKNFTQLDRIITKYAWSNSIFKNNRRRTANFIESYFMALDFDNGFELENVKNKLKELDLKYSITLTRHHMIKKTKGSVEKSPCERFRVVIPLETKITNIEDYLNTWHYLKNEFPQIDRNCKDPARFYFASTNGVYKKERS